MPTREEVFRNAAPLLRRLVEKHQARLAAEASRAPGSCPDPAVVAGTGRGDNEGEAA